MKVLGPSVAGTFNKSYLAIFPLCKRVFLFYFPSFAFGEFVSFEKCNWPITHRESACRPMEPRRRDTLTNDGGAQSGNGAFELRALPVDGGKQKKKVSTANRLENASKKRKENLFYSYLLLLLMLFPFKDKLDIKPLFPWFHLVKADNLGFHPSLFGPPFWGCFGKTIFTDASSTKLMSIWICGAASNQGTKTFSLCIPCMYLLINPHCRIVW